MSDKRVNLVPAKVQLEFRDWISNEGYWVYRQGVKLGALHNPFKDLWMFDPSYLPDGFALLTDDLRQVADELDRLNGVEGK